jgi:hypothetical protein
MGSDVTPNGWHLPRTDVSGSERQTANLRADAGTLIVTQWQSRGAEGSPPGCCSPQFGADHPRERTSLASAYRGAFGYCHRWLSALAPILIPWCRLIPNWGWSFLVDQVPVVLALAGMPACMIAFCHPPSAGLIPKLGLAIPD